MLPEQGTLPSQQIDNSLRARLRSFKTSAAEKIMQEEHDRRWKKVAEDVDDLLECFRGFDRAKEKILKRREGILTPFPDGGDWQWECYRTRQAHEREERAADRRRETLRHSHLPMWGSSP